MRFFYRILQFIFPRLEFYKTNFDNWYLTIDDSPGENTLWILDILDDYGVKATFFCIGKNVEKFPKQFEEIKKRGHAIGYHSYSHKNSWRISFRDFKADFEKQKKLFDSDLYRPPYGKFTWKIYRYVSKAHSIVLWDVLMEDWKELEDPIQILKSKISKAKVGSIIVFHDNEKSFENLKVMLPYFLEYSKKSDIQLDIL